MTRNEFETNLATRLEDIRALYQKYNPEAFETEDGVYLSIVIYKDKVMCNNGHFRKDEDSPNEYNPDKNNPVNFYKDANKEVTSLSTFIGKN